MKAPTYFGRKNWFYLNEPPAGWELTALLSVGLGAVLWDGISVGRAAEPEESEIGTPVDGVRVTVDGPVGVLELLDLELFLRLPTTPPTTAPMTISAAIRMKNHHFFRRYHGTGYGER